MAGRMVFFDHGHHAGVREARGVWGCRRTVYLDVMSLECISVPMRVQWRAVTSHPAPSTGPALSS